MNANTANWKDCIHRPVCVAWEDKDLEVYKDYDGFCFAECQHYISPLYIMKEHYENSLALARIKE